MEIDTKLLERCPVLTSRERTLIRRIDVENESQACVAESLGKTASTISIQHKKALKKLNEWTQDREGQREVPAQVSFDRTVFRMFRRGVSPDAVIEKLGNVDQVLALWEKFRKLREDDYCAALNVALESGFPGQGADPVSSALQDRIEACEMYESEDDKIREILDKQGIVGGTSKGGYGWTSEGVQRLANKLSEMRATLMQAAYLVEDNRRKDEQIAALEEENADLSRLRKYEDLTDEVIQLRKADVQALATEVGRLEDQRQKLKREVDKQTKVVFELSTMAREGVKNYLSRLDHRETLALLIDANQSKMDPLTAAFMKSRL